MDMTKEEILALKPGRELNKLVGKHVFGYSVYHYDKDHPVNCYCMLVDKELDPVSFTGNRGEMKRVTEDEAWNDCPNFSEDLDSAWEVFEHFGYQGQVGYFGNEYFCEVMHGFNDNGIGMYSKAKGETQPEAICKAALLVYVSEE